MQDLNKITVTAENGQPVEVYTNLPIKPAQRKVGTRVRSGLTAKLKVLEVGQAIQIGKKDNIGQLAKSLTPKKFSTKTINGVRYASRTV